MIDDDVFEFHQAARERGAELERRLLRDRKTDAVARLDMRDGLVRGDQPRAQLRAPIVPVDRGRDSDSVRWPSQAAAASVVLIPISRMKADVRSFSSPTFCMLLTTV